MHEQKEPNNENDHEARFLKAFDEYGDALFRHAYFRVSDREKALDLVQDTFTKTWSWVRGGHEIETFRPFLYKVLNNLVIDEYRKRKESSLDELLDQEGVSEGSFDELSESSTELLASTIDGKKALELVQDFMACFKVVQDM